ncbi:MAG: hypothetical protein FJ276_24690 [Planctomycetes bacterium]|nr:hypothetical protein [Planctomycetota bacterium]
MKRNPFLLSVICVWAFCACQPHPSQAQTASTPIPPLGPSAAPAGPQIPGVPAAVPPAAANPEANAPSARAHNPYGSVPGTNWRYGRAVGDYYGAASRWQPAPPTPDPRITQLTERYNQLESEVMRVAAEYRQAKQDDDGRDKLRQRIEELTEQQFQLRHEVRQFEIDRLQKELAQLQEQLRRREERKEEIIDRRVAQLTNQDDELRWDPLATPGAYPSAYPPAMYAPAAPGGSRAAPAPAQFPTPYFSPPDADPYDRWAAPAPAQLPTPYGDRAPGSSIGTSSPPRTTDPATSLGVSSTTGSGTQPSRAMSLSEAEARLAIAEGELAKVKMQFDAGTIPTSEFDRAANTVRIATIQLEETRKAHEFQVQMLSLELRKAEAELEAARAEKEAAEQRSKDAADDAELAAQARRATAAVEYQLLQVQRVGAMLQYYETKRAKPTPDSGDAAKQ